MSAQPVSPDPSAAPAPAPAAPPQQPAAAPAPAPAAQVALPGVEPAQPTPAAPPAPSPAATPPAPPADPAHPDWLPERLAAAKASVLRKVGLTKEEELVAKMARLQELENEKLTVEERTQKELEQLRAKAQRLDHIDGILQSVVDAQFSALPEAMRNAIDAQAAGNAERRLQALQMFQAAGVAPQVQIQVPATPVVPIVPAVPAPAPAPAPVTNAPPGAPPPPAAPQTAAQKYEQITDPIMRSVAYHANARDIELSRAPTPHQ